jgi:hypothetical protein
MYTVHTTLSSRRLLAYTVVETDCVDGHEVGKVVLVGIVVTMPSNHVKWRVILHSQQISREGEGEREKEY